MNDIETGSFEVAENVLSATNGLFDRIPEAQPWMTRIGHRAVYHFGARSLTQKPYSIRFDLYAATMICNGQF